MFIAAQSPLPVTVIDFWRMLWERRSPIVVMVMERGVERYWPVDRIKDYGDLSVEPTTERHSADYTYREFKLTDYIVSLLSRIGQDWFADKVCVCPRARALTHAHTRV